ncbi:cysteine desulfurase family protein [Sphingobacterium hungaricum]
MSIIYLDNNATTKIDPEVLETLLPYLQEQYGNASSIQHRLGREANAAIEKARQQVASSLNVKDKEIFFTSGSTEAINTVIKGVFDNYQRKGKHIITAKTEHKAVLTVCEQLEKQGAEVTYLSTDASGAIDLNELSESIRPDTILVTLMAANNETGFIHPIEHIAMRCQEKDTLYFCDATQYIGKEKIDLAQIPIDILCLSAHKIHGPKGVGALFIRRKSKPIQIEPLIVGGKQEHGFRGGTYPVHAIAGLGKAIEIATPSTSINELRDYFEAQIIQRIPETSIYCKEQLRTANCSNILFKHVRSSELMVNLPEMAIASGSACVSGDRNPSHVLKAMGYADEDAFCSIRFSLSKWTNKEELDRALLLLESACEKIRSQSPIWSMYQSGLLD